jgi:transcriptional regulator with XRE-family HTH domain
MLNSQDFIQKLELILSYYQLTASSFADKIGVQRSSISHLLSGRNKPGLEFVIKIVEHFPEVDLYWFLMNVGSFPKSEITPKKEVPVKQEEIKLKEPQELISNSNELPTIVEQTKSGKAETAAIDKIVVLYKDGSFKSYNPQE